MSELETKQCKACEAGVPPLDAAQREDLLKQINNWSLSADGKMISRRFNFKNFARTMGFVNAIAWVSLNENHHPDVEFGYNYCLVKYTTHAIDGLSENDFICAAKVDALES